MSAASRSAVMGADSREKEGGTALAAIQAAVIGALVALTVRALLAARRLE
jgi:hypothetical protein